MANKQYITFYLGEDLFGIDILMVREINRNLDITKIERAPYFVRGLLNLRGQIVTVLDLSSRLGLEQAPRNKSSSCIVLKTSQELEHVENADDLIECGSSEAVGLYVDQIGDVVPIDSEKIDPPAVHQSGIGKDFIEGVVQLEERLLVTLNIAAILSTQTESLSA